VFRYSIEKKKGIKKDETLQHEHVAEGGSPNEKSFLISFPAQFSERSAR